MVTLEKKVTTYCGIDLYDFKYIEAYYDELRSRPHFTNHLSSKHWHLIQRGSLVEEPNS